MERGFRFSLCLKECLHVTPGLCQIIIYFPIRYAVKHGEEGFIFLSLFLFACDFYQDKDDNSELVSEKAFQVDSDGNVVETEILISDFLSAHDCRECHQQHFEEWSNSMHAFSFSDPLFLL